MGWGDVVQGYIDKKETHWTIECQVCKKTCAHSITGYVNEVYMICNDCKEEWEKQKLKDQNDEINLTFKEK